MISVQPCLSSSAKNPVHCSLSMELAVPGPGMQLHTCKAIPVVSAKPVLVEAIPVASLSQ